MTDMSFRSIEKIFVPRAAEVNIQKPVMAGGTPIKNEVIAKFKINAIWCRAGLPRPAVFAL